uniref:GTPase IMAP family member 2-like n=1 Tax=Gasterosteus aculeatus aculeatus TaxID=481459 RepID=UPI001A98CAB2|nr:GTPase IMAP family member 2-like [Gasterosteus aculeatus aculeatus]
MLAAGRRTVCDGKSISKEAADLRPVKRSSSYEMLPPNLSGLRVVLLGSSWSERSSVGNFILAECLHFNQFKSEEEPDCLKQRGWLKEKEVVLINTPDLLLSWTSNHSLCEACRRLSDPGPHVFLLVYSLKTSRRNTKRSSAVSLSSTVTDHLIIHWFCYQHPESRAQRS